MNNFSHRFLSCCLQSRSSFDKLMTITDTKTLSPDVSYLLTKVDEYYTRDKDATSIDLPTLQERVKMEQAKESKAELLNSVLTEAFGIDVSPANFVDLLKETKLQAMLPDVVAALQDPSKADKREALLSDYMNISISEASEDEDDVYHNVTIEDSLKGALDKSNRMFLAPGPLNELVGGVGPEDSILVLARPEAGKTALCATIACGFAYYGHPGIVFLNEDATDKIVARYQSCLTGMTGDQMRAHPRDAQELLEARGWDNIRFIPMTPGNPAFVERYVKKYPVKWVLIDQLRNMEGKADGLTRQLESNAKEIRNIAKRHKLAAISVTQAGDSGENKLFLQMGDIDSSNTGVPGAMDVIVGIGSNEEYNKNNMRVFNLSKNKLTGVHGHTIVRLRPEISRYEAI